MQIWQEEKMMRFLFLIVAEIDIDTRLQIYYVQIYWKYIANALQIHCKYIAIIWQTYCKYIEIFKLGSKYMLHIDYFEINTFRATLHIFFNNIMKIQIWSHFSDGETSTFGLEDPRTNSKLNHRWNPISRSTSHT